MTVGGQPRERRARPLLQEQLRQAGPTRGHPLDSPPGWLALFLQVGVRLGCHGSLDAAALALVLTKFGIRCLWLTNTCMKPPHILGEVQRKQRCWALVRPSMTHGPPISGRRCCLHRFLPVWDPQLMAHEHLHGAAAHPRRGAEEPAVLGLSSIIDAWVASACHSKWLDLGTPLRLHWFLPRPAARGPAGQAGWHRCPAGSGSWLRSSGPGRHRAPAGTSARQPCGTCPWRGRSPPGPARAAGQRHRWGT